MKNILSKITIADCIKKQYIYYTPKFLKEISGLSLYDFIVKKEDIVSTLNSIKGLGKSKVDNIITLLYNEVDLVINSNIENLNIDNNIKNELSAILVTDCITTQISHYKPLYLKEISDFSLYDFIVKKEDIVSTLNSIKGLGKSKVDEIITLLYKEIDLVINSIIGNHNMDNDNKKELSSILVADCITTQIYRYKPEYLKEISDYNYSLYDFYTNTYKVKSALNQIKGLSNSKVDNIITLLYNQIDLVINKDSIKFNGKEITIDDSLKTKLSSVKIHKVLSDFDYKLGNKIISHITEYDLDLLQYLKRPGHIISIFNEIKQLGQNKIDRITETINSEVAIILGLKDLEKIKSDYMNKFLKLEEAFPKTFNKLVDDFLAADTLAKTNQKLYLCVSLLDGSSEISSMIHEYQQGATLQELGEKYNYTRERVRQKINIFKDCFVKAKTKEWAISCLNRLIKDLKCENKLPADEELNNYDPRLKGALRKYFADKSIKTWGIDARLSVIKNLNFETENDPRKKVVISIEEGIKEIRRIAKLINRPDHMPKQIELRKYGNDWMSSFVKNNGGQQKLAQLSGLIYQGQQTNEDGSRRYWTKERVGIFLKEVSEFVGRPGVMPKTSEILEYAPNPSITTTLKKLFPGGALEIAEEYGLKYDKQFYSLNITFIRKFVKSLGDAIYHMTPAEIYVIFQQQGIGSNIRPQERTFDKLTDAIQSGKLPKEELEKWKNGNESEFVNQLLNKENSTVEEALTKASKSNDDEDLNSINNDDEKDYKESLDERLPAPAGNHTLESLELGSDALIRTSSDKEAVQFLIAKAADKLWKRCFENEDLALEEIKTHDGNLYSNSAKEKFIEEYSRSKQLPLPDGYAFKDPTGKFCEPKLMQKLIAYRVLTKHHVLNLSGTGTGKTLSAILSSRVIGSQLTIIACPNATVDSWAKNIINTFPDSEVIKKPYQWQVSWRGISKFKYIVVNHEMFQDRVESNLKLFINENPYDFVVIDELHQVKKRDSDSESQRRRLMTGLITDIPEGRPMPRVLGMSATPVINNLYEGKSLLELVTAQHYDDIGSETNIQNCMKLFQQFTTLGFRMMPLKSMDRTPTIHPVDATPQLKELTSLRGRYHPQHVEEILIKSKWDSIKKCLKPKTVIFTEYIKGIIGFLKDNVIKEGYSCAFYTGNDKDAIEEGYNDSLDEFLNGHTQVLIASIRTLATGIDGLQYISNNVIFATLPWTSSDYDQALGRFDREGSVFKELHIHIPKTYMKLSSGEKWSWCESRIKRIENKRDISKASVDGEIPDSDQQLTPSKATNYWITWLNRLNENILEDIQRNKIRVPLNDKTDIEYVESKYHNYESLKSNWQNSNAKDRHQDIQKDPKVWSYFHTKRESEVKSWGFNPIDRIIDKIKKQCPINAVIADYGCGTAPLAEKLSNDYLVHSLDHIAINPSVHECEMSSSPLEDESVDAAVFCLSLIDNDVKQPLKDGYRTLKKGGQLFIWTDRNDITDSMIKECGFTIIESLSESIFFNFWAIKS